MTPHGFEQSSSGQMRADLGAEAGVDRLGALGRVSHEVARGLARTPFDPRLRAASIADAWVPWAGYSSPSVLESVANEYFAIRNQATLFDVTPMKKARVSGPDAERVMNRLVTRDVTKLAPGRVAYALWCDEDGHVIDDGTIFRLAPDVFRLNAQDSQIGWLADVAAGFDAEIADETHAVAGLALQGPTAFSVLAAAGLGALGRLKPFELAEPEPGLLVSRTGFTGDLGYELWVSPDSALALWDRLTAAGRDHGLRAIGYAAMNIARIEAGFLLPRADFQPIHHAIRPTRGRTPFELGYGRLVDFGKGPFNGRRALLRHAEKGPRTTLALLDVDGPKPAGSALVYHKKRREVGFVTSATWSPTCKRNLALAELRAPYGLTRTDDLCCEIYAQKEGKWERIMAKARVVERPAFRHARARKTPPDPF